MPAVVAAFVKAINDGNDSCFIHPNLNAYFLEGVTEWAGQPLYFTGAEYRFIVLYWRNRSKIPPWRWDYEHYTGENRCMMGMYYQEDLVNIEMADQFVYERRKKEMEQKRR